MPAVLDEQAREFAQERGRVAYTGDLRSRYAYESGVAGAAAYKSQAFASKLSAIGHLASAFGSYAKGKNAPAWAKKIGKHI